MANFIEFKTKQPNELIDDIRNFATDNEIMGYSQYTINSYSGYYGLELNIDFINRMVEAGFNKFLYLERI